MLGETGAQPKGRRAARTEYRCAPLADPGDAEVQEPPPPPPPPAIIAAEDSTESLIAQLGNQLTTSSRVSSVSVDERTGVALAALHSFLTSRCESVSPDAFPDPLVRKLFVQLNTAMPTSAASERLFSVGKRVVSDLRHRLADSTIEASLVVCCNAGKVYE